MTCLGRGLYGPLICVRPVWKPHCWFSHEVAHLKFIEISSGMLKKFEPGHEKTNILHAKTKAQISFAVTAKLISAFALATQIAQSLSCS